MDANVSFTGNLGTDVEMKIGEGWRVGRWDDDLDVGARLWPTR